MRTLDGPQSLPGASAVPGLWSREHRPLTAGLVMTITLVAFESLAVATIMPLVARDLAARNGLELYGWVLSAFFLGNLIGIVVVGGLIDTGGLVKPLAVGLGLFTAGLVAGGLAPSMQLLVLARLIQGIGGGAIPPIAYVSIGRALPEALRARMFAVMSAAWVVPGIIGPAISGTIGQYTSWRVVFLGLIPLILVAAAITLPAVGAVSRASGRDVVRPPWNRAAQGHRRRLWLAIVLAAGAALTIAGLTDGTIIPGGVGIAVGLLLLVPTFRILTPPGTLRAARGLPAAVLLRGGLTFAFFCADAYVPLALQDWRGIGAAAAGLALTGSTVSWSIGAAIQARLYPSRKAAPLVRLGFAVLVVGIVAFAAGLSPSVPVAVAIAAWSIAGLGIGLAYAPLSLVVLEQAPEGATGMATAGLQLSDILGTAVGTGVGGALVAIGARAGLAGWVGLLGAFSVGAAAALVGMTLAGRLREAPGDPALGRGLRETSGADPGLG